MKISNTKTGISLIVLVITIIIMIILAAAVIISLENTGIIGAAENAVCKTNIKQAQNLAVLKWAELYTNGERNTATIKEEIKEEFTKNKLNPDDYNIEVTTGGVEVSSKAGCVDSSGIEGGNVGNPEDNNTPSTEWSYAYAYNATTKAWSDRISKADVTEDVTGDIVAKLYEMNETTEIVEYTADGETTTIPAGKAYKMVVEGSGDLTVLNMEATDPNNVYGAWFKDMINSMDNFGNTVTSYITHVEVSDNITSVGRGAFLNLFNLKSIKLPSNLTRIEHDTFSSCLSLTNVKLPDTVTFIGEFAFNSCFALTFENNTLPTGLIEIYDQAFSESGLKKIILPEGVTTIGDSAFEGNDLEEVTLPVSLTTVSNDVFARCNNLKTINYNGTADQWNNISNIITQIPTTPTINFAK